MLKTLFLGFGPWLIYLLAPSNTLYQFKTAIVLSLIAAIILQLRELKKGFVLSWGTLIFFMFMVIGVIGFNNSWIIKYAGLISNSALVVISLLSIMIGKPFTIQYAKETVTADKWQHPIFIRINYLLSAFWLFMFVLGLLIYLCKVYFQINHFLYVILSYIPLIVGTLVSAWFPNWYKNYYRSKMP